MSSPAKTALPASSADPDKVANPAPLLTVSEVAAFLQVNPATVYRLADSGRLPCVRIGRALRFERSALLDRLRGTERS